MPTLQDFMPKESAQDAAAKGVDMGVKLALTQENVAKQRQEMEMQKVELTQKRLQVAQGLMSTYVKMDPSIRNKFADQIKDQARKAEVPLDGLVDAIGADPSLAPNLQNIMNHPNFEKMSPEQKIQALTKADPMDHMQGLPTLIKLWSEQASTEQKGKIELTKERETRASTERVAGIQAAANHEKEVQNDAQKFADNLEKANIPAFEDSISKVYEMIDTSKAKDPQEKALIEAKKEKFAKRFAGLNTLDIKKIALGDLKADKETQKFAQYYMNTANQYVKTMTGANMGEAEADRYIRDTIGIGLSKSPGAVWNGLEIMQNLVQSKKSNLTAGQAPEVVDRYDKRKASITPKAPVKKAAGPSAPDAKALNAVSQMIKAGKVDQIRSSQAYKSNPQMYEDLIKQAQGTTSAGGQ